MKTALVLGACLLACTVCGWSVYSQRRAVVTATQEVATLTSRAAAAAAAAERARQRLGVVEADTAQLLDQIATLSSKRRQDQRSPGNEAIRERHTRARELAERGAWQEALADYLWCYDHAFLRSSALIKNFALLAKSYPPAAVELQVRSQEAEARARHDPINTDALQDFIMLDSVLNQSARSFAFHDELPETDERRLQIARALVKEFITMQRYSDVSAIVPKYESTVADLDARLEFQRKGPRAVQSPPANEHQRLAIERARAAQFKATIDSAAMAMEVLAGLGQSDRARTIAEKILLLDTSPETRAAVSARLDRTGMTAPSDLHPAEPRSTVHAADGSDAER